MNLQEDMFKPVSDWVAPTVLPDLQQFPIIGIDTETKDPSIGRTRSSGWPWREGEVIGISLATPAFAAYYPIAHEGGDNMDRDKVLAWLTHELGRYTGKLVGLNLLYDLGWLSNHGVVAPYATLRDVGFLMALLDENRASYSLNAIAKSLGLPPKNEAMLEEAARRYGLDPKGQMYMLPARHVGPYAEHDARLPVLAYDKLWPLIEAENLQNVVDLEHGQIPILMQMRRNGVRIDEDRAHREYANLKAREADVLHQMKKLSNMEPDIWSNDSVATYFNALNINIPRTALGKPSFRKEWLEAHPHEGARMLREARKIDKAANTFVKNAIIDNCHSGRVHCEFHPLRSDDGGTVSGRYSSSGPNLQQVPARDPELAPIVRGLFLPEPGHKWYSIDYAQQEPRFTVHFAVMANCRGARAAADRIIEDPRVDYHKLTAEITGLPRSEAKVIFLGRAYGMGGASLCHDLGYPTKYITIQDKHTGQDKEIEVAGDAGEAVMRQYDALFPFVRELSRVAKNAAAVRGHIITHSGRRCHFNLYEPTYRWALPMPYDEAVRRYGTRVQRAETRKALNKLIQGSSADMIKYAHRAVYEAGMVDGLRLTIHDELGLSLPDDGTAEEVGRLMTGCVKLEVPLAVDIASGNTWGETM